MKSSLYCMEHLKLSLDRGQTILDGLMESGVPLRHECGGTLACATCCVTVHDGFGGLSPIGEEEQDMLERAGAAGRNVRLACQVISSGGDVVIEIPAAEIVQRTAAVLHTVVAVAVTERAAQHLRTQLAARPDAVAVRLAVEPAGCSGLRYRLDHAEAIADDDVVFECQGIRIVIDRKDLPFVQGATLDLVHERLGRKLRLQNPNARQTCGCGESFAV